MFYAVDYKEGKIGVLDTDDNSVEYFGVDTIKYITKHYKAEIYGVTLAENINPKFTIRGLEINLYYRNAINLGRFKAVLLNKGDLWGCTFSKVISKPTVAIFDMESSLPKNKYPSGQYICSYYADTLLEHNDNFGLQFDTSVDSWKISSKDMQDLKMFLKSKL